MARSRSRPQRVASDNASGLDALLRPPVTPTVLTPDLEVKVPSDLEDRRLYHPAQSWAPAMAAPGRPGRVVMRAPVVSPAPARLARPSGMAAESWRFEDPERVAVCVRRKRRREVLHALRRTGRGAGAKRRRNQLSDVRC